MSKRLKGLNNKPQNIKGFTLIELLVAIMLGMFVILGAIQIFISNTRSYELIEGVARIQENSRFANELVSRALRMSGHPLDSFLGQRIIGIDALGENGSDTITIQYQDAFDCAGDAVIPPDYAEHTYYILNNTLVCRGNSGTVDVIVDGVENLQIFYGEDVDLDALPDRYVNATDVSNWNNITSVRLHYLMTSVNPSLEDPQEYFFQGVNTMPADRLLRQEYTSTITLRSRIL